MLIVCPTGGSLENYTFDFFKLNNKVYNNFSAHFSNISFQQVVVGCARVYVRARDEERDHMSGRAVPRDMNATAARTRMFPKDLIKTYKLHAAVLLGYTWPLLKGIAGVLVSVGRIVSG